jgi:hypothetical protein
MRSSRLKTVHRSHIDNSSSPLAEAQISGELGQPPYSLASGIWSDWGREYALLLVDHSRKLLLLTPPDPKEVHVRNTGPFVVCHLMSPFPDARNPCIVHGNVEAAELVRNLSDPLPHLSGMPHVHLQLQDLGPGALSADYLCRLPQAVHVDVSQCQPGDPVLGERCCRGSTEPWEPLCQQLQINRRPLTLRLTRLCSIAERTPWSRERTTSTALHAYPSQPRLRKLYHVVTKSSSIDMCPNR